MLCVSLPLPTGRQVRRFCIPCIYKITINMKQEISFADFFAKVKIVFAEHKLALPEDIELLELSHMEMLEAETPVDEFIENMVKEYGGV
jgi:hypothetical protein